MFPFIVIAGAVAVSIAAAALKLRRDQELSLEWRRWVTERDWRFHDTWNEMPQQFDGGPFGVGHNRRADRGFEGAFDGLPVFGMRYRYVRGSGKHQSTWTHQVLGVRFPGARFPAFSLRPEGFLNGRDVQFENEAFNRRWSVTSASPRFAHDVIHPRMMAFLMGPLPHFDTLWFNGDSLLFARYGDADPRGVDATLRMMSTVADLIPSFVLREVGSAAPVVDRSGPSAGRSEHEQWLAELAAAEAASAERAAAAPEQRPQPSPTPLPPPVTPLPAEPWRS